MEAGTPLWEILDPPLNLIPNEINNFRVTAVDLWFVVLVTVIMFKKVW